MWWRKIRQPSCGLCAFVLLLFLGYVKCTAVASREESPCILDFHVDYSDEQHQRQHPHENNNSKRTTLAVHELRANHSCASGSEFWFYSEDYSVDSVINKHLRQQWWSRNSGSNVPDANELVPYYGGDEEDNNNTNNAAGDLTVGTVRCDGLACVPPFWSWWSTVRAQCTLEWVGQRAQRVADRAPWDSGAQWMQATQKLSMTVEDTYIMVKRGESPAAYVWHCHMYPRVYSAVSLQCSGDPVVESADESNSTASVARGNYQVHNIQRQCTLNVHVGRGAHLLIYIVSAVLVVGACGAYLCCIWLCCVCCRCRTWPCVRRLPCFRESHNSIARQKHRAARDMGPNGGGGGAYPNGAVDSAWELPSAKPAGFKSTFARLARVGGVGSGGLRGAQMV